MTRGTIATMRRPFQAEWQRAWWVFVVVVVEVCSGATGSTGAAHRTSAPLTREATTGSAISAGAPPTSPPPSLPPTGPGSPPVTAGPRHRHAVALTFDSNLTDSMIRELDTGKVASFDNTAVIDELDEARVPATLFLAGRWMERYPETVRRLAADPLFELGSHSYAHLGFTEHCYDLGRIPEDRMAADVQRSEDLLRSFTPKATKLFRFPGGCFDDAALRAVEPTGVTVVQYDVASGDAFGHSVPAIVGQVLDRARNGSIVVMHITGGNTAPLTADALPAIVAGLRARGFDLETVTQLLTATTPG
jgi:peptidoglycan/xylan/chitin deacetylase (PgdA/CDA1 family)